RRLRAALRAGRRAVVARADRRRRARARGRRDAQCRRALSARGRHPVRARPSRGHRPDRLGRDRALLRGVGAAHGGARRAGGPVAWPRAEPRGAPPRPSQPYWAVRAHLLAELGETAAAEAAYARAIELSEDSDVRAFLLERRTVRRTACAKVRGGRRRD